MPKHVTILLIKIVSSLARAEMILDGQLYCNTVRFLREEFDEYEGSIPLTGEIRIYGYLVPKEDLAEPPRLTVDVVLDLNVFCMFSWAPPKVGDDQITINPVSQFGSMERLLQTFGEHAVVITNVTEFFQRTDNAVPPSNIRVLDRARDLVDYVNPNVGIAPPTNRWESIKVAHRKDKKFAHEKEYRLVYLTTCKPPGPVILNIGDIRDIAIRMRTEDIYNSIKLNDLPLSHFQ